MFMTKNTLLMICLFSSHAIAAEDGSNYRERLLQSLNALSDLGLIHVAGHVESREGMASDGLPIVNDGNVDIHMEAKPGGVYKITFEPLRIKWHDGAAPYLIEYKTICIGPHVSMLLLDKKGPEGATLGDIHHAELFSEFPKNNMPRPTFTGASFIAPLIRYEDDKYLVNELSILLPVKTINISEGELNKHKCLILEYRHPADATVDTCYFSLDHNLALLQRNYVYHNEEGLKIKERIYTVNGFKQLGNNVFFPSKVTLSVESKREAGLIFEKTTVEYTTVEISNLTKDSIVPTIPAGWEITDHRIGKVDK